MDKDNNQNSNLDDELEEITKSLAGQISQEMDSQLDKTDLEENKKPKWIKIASITGGTIVSVLLVLFIVANVFLGRINFTDWKDTKNQKEEFEEGEGNGDEIDPDSVNWGTNGSLRQDKNTLNILLVGEEKINDGKRGRSDSIMIATMNVKQKAIKLTSLMRDMYVQIPGYSDNKLNSAYHTGGMPLLKETIQLNFDIELDGAVLVDFNDFESLIDKLGGVEITLTESEANYLNTTNYISNPANRNVRVGTQTLNGNQALGYTRIRYRKSINGEADDFGRTSRQRIVLNAIFEKYKSKNIAELVLLINDILPLVETDISKSDIVSYAGTFVTLGTTKLETMRIPIDQGFTRAYIRKMDVLLPDLPANIDALHTFIFGSSNMSSNIPDSLNENSNVGVDSFNAELNTSNP